MPDKSSVSKANSYQGIGEFWDEHDASEFGEQRTGAGELVVGSNLNRCICC